MTRDALETVPRGHLYLITRLRIGGAVPLYRRVEPEDRARRVERSRALTHVLQDVDVRQSNQPPSRVEQVQHVEDIELKGESMSRELRKRLAHGDVCGVHPRGETTVALHDPPALAAKTRCARDESLERHLLALDVIRIRAPEQYLVRVGRVARYVDRIVGARAVGVEIAKPRSRRRVKVCEPDAGFADVREREIGRPSLPRRSVDGGENGPVRDVER